MKNIKPYKGRLVQIDFGDNNQMTGIIVANAKNFIVFDVNDSQFEITIRYEKIHQVKRIKSKNKEGSNGKQ